MTTQLLRPAAEPVTTPHEAAHPYDRYNQKLVANVHPADWTNPVPSGRYNLVVIGAGTAGLVSAAGAAGLGAKVALIERSLMGGDCLNVGCVPSKALIAAARAAAELRSAHEFGISTAEGVVDFAAVMERMRRLRSEISPHDSAARFRSLGIDVYLGQGRFTGKDRIEIGGQTLSFQKAVIATGARAVRPDIPGLADIEPLTNETVFSLTELPRRFAVLGGGPIGCELAQSFARFGSEVTLIEASGHILSREDVDAAAIVQESLQRDGVSLRLHSKVVRAERMGDESRLWIETAGVMTELTVDAVLVAAGRAPNVEGLGLEAAGIAYDRRAGVHVNDRLQTSNSRVYAAGDICSRFKFTHAADFMARIVIQNALFLGRAKASALTIPWATYTSPELAHVGLSEAEAAQKGIAVDTFVQPFDHVDRAILDGQTAGFVKVHVRRGTDRILGATVVAEHAGDMISELTLAMTQKVGLGKIARVIHPYPTQAEAIRKLGDQYNRTRLTPFVKGMFRRWLAWTR